MAQISRNVGGWLSVSAPIQTTTPDQTFVLTISTATLMMTKARKVFSAIPALSDGIPLILKAFIKKSWVT